MHEHIPKLRVTKLNNYPFSNKRIIKIKFRKRPFLLKRFKKRLLNINLKNKKTNFLKQINIIYIKIIIE